eukprot:gb/GECG01003256.1/.p1 GENE.gb/GECG01003256.1/~~gb/GECG01003256.1/.p1  ORF type:complete len:451 (+),score=44.10 gb/GECG01003256.1/:1-1353(+)
MRGADRATRSACHARGELGNWKNRQTGDSRESLFKPAPLGIGFTRCAQFCLVSLVLVLPEILSHGMCETVSPSPSFSPSPTQSVSGSPSTTASSSVTSSLSTSPSQSTSVTASVSRSRTNSPSTSVTPSFSASVTATPSETPSVSMTPSITSTSGSTPSITPSVSVTGTPDTTATPSVSPLASFVCESEAGAPMEGILDVISDDETYLHMFFPIEGTGIESSISAFRFLIAEKLGTDTAHVREIRAIEGSEWETLEEAGVDVNDTGIEFAIIFSQGDVPTFSSIDEDGPPADEQLEESMSQTLSLLHEREFRAELLDTMDTLSDVNIDIEASLDSYIIVLSSRCTANTAQESATQPFFRTSYFMGGATVAGILMFAILAVLFTHGRRRKVKRSESKQMALTPTVVSTLRGHHFRSFDTSPVKVEETEDNVSVINPRAERKRINKKRGIKR